MSDLSASRARGRVAFVAFGGIGLYVKVSPPPFLGTEFAEFARRTPRFLGVSFV